MINTQDCETVCSLLLQINASVADVGVQKDLRAPNAWHSAS